MKYNRQLAQQRVNNHIKSSGHMDLSPSAWCTQPQRRAVSLGDRTGKRGSTGTGVFLPRSPVTAQTRKKPSKFYRLLILAVQYLFCFCIFSDRNVLSGFSSWYGFGSG